MEFKEVMEKFKTDSDPKILLDALEELSQACSEASAEAQRASKAYYANAEAKKQKITDRIEDLRKQLKGCETKIESFKKPLVSATVSGDSQKLEEIKARMKEQEVEKIQLATEIDMLESTHVSGNKDLYEAVVKKNAVHEKLRESYVSAKVEAHTLAREIIKGYEKLQRRTQNFHAGGGIGANLVEIENHFHQGGTV